MKFHEALAAAQRGHTPPRREPVSQTNGVWLVNNSGLVNVASPLEVANHHKVWVRHPTFVDLDLGLVIAEDGTEASAGPYVAVRTPGANESSDGIAPRVAMPAFSGIGPTYSGGEQTYPFTFATRLNGQFWGFGPFFNCRTSTTTTPPPCSCSSVYPDMRVTVSGVTEGTNGICTTVDPNAPTEFCSRLNRTWCLYFRNSGTKCSWLSNKIQVPCPTISQLQLALVWPETLQGCPGSGCTYATLKINGQTVWQSCDFDPLTGGTFTKITTSPGFSAFFDCRTIPNTVTVSVASNCTTTTSTTTTTTTTSTSSTTGAPTTPPPLTTSTTTTSTSSTTSAPFCGWCAYMWFGDDVGWVPYSSSCRGVCVQCLLPSASAEFLYQIREGTCSA